MTLTLIEHLQASQLVTDADTGEPDTSNHQARRPVRVFVLPNMPPEPTLDRTRMQAELAQVARILKHYQPPFREVDLAKLLNVPVERAIDLTEDEALRMVASKHETQLDELRAAHTRERERQIAAARNCNRVWAFRNRLVRVDDADGAPREEIAVRVMHLVLANEADLARVQNEVAGYLAGRHTNESDRPRIPDAVRRFVWRRDSGRCARCGSRERLEFDHIIPLSRGGHNTARNIELLCESCNRRKGNTI